MTVVHGYPPNILEIRKAFPIDESRTIFAYAPHIYVPSGHKLPFHLIVHEKTHHGQQGRTGGPAAWWTRYIDDPDFRLQQEVEAYRAQWRAASGLVVKQRRQLLSHIVADLSSVMYGGLVSSDEAFTLVTG